MSRDRERETEQVNEGRSSSLLSSVLAIEVLCASFTLGVSFHGRRFAVSRWSSPP